MKVLIIEDEAPAFRRLQKILEEIEPGVEIVEVIDSVEDAVKFIRNHQEPDLYFMDIQLSDGISFQIFEQVKITRPVIFTTAFDEYMLRAFKVNSIDYLLKPIKAEDMQASLQKFKSLKAAFSGQSMDIQEVLSQIRLTEKSYKTRFLVKMGDKMLAVETSNIAYFFTKHGVVHLMTQAGKTYLMDQSMEEIQSQLDPQRFYRANRQFILHFDSIAAVHRYHKGKLLAEVKPEAGEEVIISAEKAADFKSWMGD